MNVPSDDTLLRLKQILGDPKANPPIPPRVPVSKSTWWEGVRTKRFPQPTYVLGPKIPTWRNAEIRALLEREGAEASRGA